MCNVLFHFDYVRPYEIYNVVPLYLQTIHLQVLSHSLLHFFHCLHVRKEVAGAAFGWTALQYYCIPLVQCELFIISRVVVWAEGVIFVLINMGLIVFWQLELSITCIKCH